MIWFLTRKCSAYNSPDLNLGLFDSESKAIAAQAKYIEYYQTHPDPLHDQCYHKVDLNKDLEIESDDSFGDLSGPLIYMIFNSCEGFGQIYRDRVEVLATLDEVREKGQILWQENHVKCLTGENGEHRVDEDGEEQCCGYVARMFLSVFILNRLQYNDKSMYYEHHHTESVEEIRKLLEKEFESEVEDIFDSNFRKEERYQDWVTESAGCSSPSELKEISHMKVDLPLNWPGLAQLKELHPLMMDCASKILAVYPLAVAQLQKDLIVPEHLVSAYNYIIGQLY